jgi:endonuclease/exonuclease/phosphatase family metal-dependent hydrolase
MRLASYNVENLFDRAKVMNLDTQAEGRPVLEKFAQLNTLLAKLDYSAADKARTVQLLIDLGLEKSDQSKFVLLRRNRGRLLKRPQAGGLEITADGRADWVGSLELRTEPIRHTAVLNTARIIAELDADILAVVEAEDRPSLSEFNEAMVEEVGGTPYRHVMLIDGNDDRGIDVGLMCKDGFAIRRMCSHVDDRLPNGELVFSRDCAHYEIGTPGGTDLIVLVNHLKSKGFGTPASSNARRLAQANRVKEIYKDLRDAGNAHIAVVGDFNDTPDSAPLKPLIEDTDLKDVFVLPQFDDGGFPGTFGGSTASNKIDYILLSPPLAAKMTGGGVNRRGIFKPTKWAPLPELTRAEDAASDHAALWVDLDA